MGPIAAGRPMHQSVAAPHCSIMRLALTDDENQDAVAPFRLDDEHQLNHQPDLANNAQLPFGSRSLSTSGVLNDIPFARHVFASL